jgi:SAM-dependent methyltransferase
MMSPWYERYFGPDYWSVAKYEYTSARTSREILYLRAVLAEFVTGQRIADLGCGIGRHAVPLASHGFDVVAIDASQWAVQQVKSAARKAGVSLEAYRADLLTADLERAVPFDAAICIQAFGWGSDADQLRMLRRIRCQLRPGGVLILDHSNASAILRNYVPDATFVASDVTATFHREYHAATGRSQGWVDVQCAGGRGTRIHDDVRLYQPPEVDRLLRAAGFVVERVDGEFTVRGEVTSDTRYVQFVARKPTASAG